MRVGLLGPLEAKTCAGDTVVIAAPKQRTILANLALRPNQNVSNDVLAESVWPGEKPPNFKPALLTYVARLRRSLHSSAERIQTASGGYRLEIQEDRELDHLHAGALEPAARKALCGNDFITGERLADEALALWRGEPLEDVPCDRLRGDCGPSFEALRLRLEETRLDAMMCMAHFERALPRLLILTAANPLVETLYERRLVALYCAGRRADALEVYRQARRELREGIGADPSHCLQELHRLVLRDAAPSEVMAVWRAARAEAHSGGKGAVELTVPVEVPAAEEPLIPTSQLPRRPRLVVGRDRELAELTALLTGPDEADAAARIAAVVGPAGVGKTTLALAWAHSVAGHFPDGQMYLDLNGFSAEGRPVTADVAIGALLDFLGVPSARVPATLQGRAALYHGLVADKRLLMLFDNVRDAAQVRPLLPSGDACRALVTSRRSLASLVALDGAELVPLAPLSAGAARELLVRRLGDRRTSGQEEALEAIAESCAHLPLALSVASARAVSTAALPLSEFAAQLDEGALTALTAGDEASSVRNVLSWSYLRLTEEAAGVFRLLGLHPGPEITTAAAAALAGIPAAQAAPLVGDLAAMSLLTEHAPGRYTMHSLLRAFAAELAEGNESAAARAAAVHRLYDYHLRWAVAADHSYSTLPADVAPDGVPLPAGLETPVFADEQAGMQWMTREQLVLSALIGHAAATGAESYAWRLAAAQSSSLMKRGRMTEELHQARIALAAAKRLDDPKALGHCYFMIGRALTYQDEIQTARFQLRRAHRFFQGIGAVAQIGEVHRTLGACAHRVGDRDGAVEHMRAYLAAARAAGHDAGISHALGELGSGLTARGEYEKARVYCLEALAIARAVGRTMQEAHALSNLGRIHEGLGDLESARDYYQNARDVFARLPEPDHPWVEYSTADLLAVSGRVEQAAEIWRDISRTRREQYPTLAEGADKRLADYGFQSRCQPTMLERKTRDMADA
jgi:DNA-binding SARP family transcriptional activator